MRKPVPALFPAVVGLASLALVACSAPAPAPTTAAPSPEFPRVIAVMDAPYSDIPLLQADGAGEWTVRTQPTEGDRVAVRAVIDSNDDGVNDPYGDVAAVMSKSAVSSDADLSLVLSPDESEVWAVTATQAAAHPELEPVTGLLQ